MRNKTIILLVVGVVVVLLLLVGFFGRSEVQVENIGKISENILPKQEGLPSQVEAKRRAIYRAALSWDYEKLVGEASENFFYSFGGEYEGGFIGYLKLSEKDEQESAFDIIPTLLALPYAVKDDLYTWPSVYTIPPENWTKEDIDMMRTFLSEEEIASFRQFGGYIYYRLGITSDGEWTFYLAGD